MERALSKRAKELGVWKQLKFYGPQNQVECWLAASDLFVLPARFEPDGSPVLEALASEIPVVVSDRVGQAELIEDGAAGVKVPYGDASALVAQILRLAGDPELTARLSAAGRVVAERYTREAALEAIRAYAEAAAAKGAVRAGA